VRIRPPAGNARNATLKSLLNIEIGGDRLLGEALAAQMKLVATDVTVVIVHNSGHWIFEEQPKKTTAALVDFVQR
jgi:pimeloyl-ACP methyl ester carboxylesterase